MSREKCPTSVFFAFALTLIQLLFIFFPTVYFTEVNESRYSANYETTALSPASSMSLMLGEALQLSDAEDALDYAKRHSDDDYYDDSYEDKALRSIREETAPYKGGLAVLTPTLSLAIFFLARGAKSSESSKKSLLHLALSATFLFLFSLFTMIVFDGIASDNLSSDDGIIKCGLTIFGWLSVIGMVTQWIIYLSCKEDIYTTTAKHTTATTMTAYTSTRPSAFPSETASYVPFSNPTPQPPQSRVKSSFPTTVTKPEPDGEICSACGTKMPPSCRFCYKCGADLHQHSSGN